MYRHPWGGICARRPVCTDLSERAGCEIPPPVKHRHKGMYTPECTDPCGTCAWEPGGSCVRGPALSDPSKRTSGPRPKDLWKRTCVRGPMPWEPCARTLRSPFIDLCVQALMRRSFSRGTSHTAFFTQARAKIFLTGVLLHGSPYAGPITQRYLHKFPYAAPCAHVLMHTNPGAVVPVHRLPSTGLLTQISFKRFSYTNGDQVRKHRSHCSAHFHVPMFPYTGLLTQILLRQVPAHTSLFRGPSLQVTVCHCAQVVVYRLCYPQKVSSTGPCSQVSLHRSLCPLTEVPKASPRTQVPLRRTFPVPIHRSLRRSLRMGRPVHEFRCTGALQTGLAHSSVYVRPSFFTQVPARRALSFFP